MRKLLSVIIGCASVFWLIQGEPVRATVIGPGASVSGFGNISTALGSSRATSPNDKILFRGYSGVTISATGKQVSIKQSSDYLLSTWTPYITFESPGSLSLTYAIQNGYYTKIGKQVTLYVSLATSSLSIGTASGNLLIGGLPFPASSAYGLSSTGSVRWNLINKSGFTDIVMQITYGTSNILLAASGMNQGTSYVTASDVIDGGPIALIGTISYVTP